MPEPRRLAAFLTVGVIVAGCGRATPPLSPPATAQRRCLVATDSLGIAQRITLVSDRVDAVDRARRAVDALPLVRLDCEGRPDPALATAWSHDTSARFWTLVLTPTRTADSLSWTAPALAAAWRAGEDSRATLRLGGVESLVPLDDARLVVGFASAHPELPALFADRALGVPAAGSHLPALDAAASDGDLRDAIDAGADVVQTDDPAIVDYAAQRGGRASVPLPWSRVYLLLVPPGHSGLERAVPSDTSGFREALSRDAVHADARAASVGWWDSTATCPAPSPTHLPRSGPVGNTLGYPGSDRVARELAERIVALAGDPALRAVGMDDRAFALALRTGAPSPLIVPADLRPAVPCREAASWPAGWHAIALVATRAYALVRRGAPAVAVEWDGTLRPEVP
jgi:hypothetical protein